MSKFSGGSASKWQTFFVMFRVKNQNESSFMTKKEKFVLFVYLNAMARDNEARTADASRIACHAARLNEQTIPINTINASQVFVSYCHGRSRGYKWMRKLG